jgi:hypothetical protein
MGMLTDCEFWIREWMLGPLDDYLRRALRSQKPTGNGHAPMPYWKKRPDIRSEPSKPPELSEADALLKFLSLD